MFMFAKWVSYCEFSIYRMTVDKTFTLWQLLLFFYLLPPGKLKIYNMTWCWTFSYLIKIIHEIYMVCLSIFEIKCLYTTIVNVLRILHYLQISHNFFLLLKMICIRSTCSSWKLSLVVDIIHVHWERYHLTLPHLRWKVYDPHRFS